MNGTQAKCGHTVTAVGAPGSLARMKCETVPCGSCRDKQPGRWTDCPACGWIYDSHKSAPPRVPIDIRCACCCQ